MVPYIVIFLATKLASSYQLPHWPVFGRLSCSARSAAQIPSPIFLIWMCPLMVPIGLTWNVYICSPQSWKAIPPSKVIALERYVQLLGYLPRSPFPVAIPCPPIAMNSPVPRFWSFVPVPSSTSARSNAGVVPMRSCGSGGIFGRNGTAFPSRITGTMSGTLGCMSQIIDRFVRIFIQPTAHHLTLLFLSASSG